VGARVIQRTKLSSQMAAYRNLRKRIASRPGSVTVTIVRNCQTKAIRGVAISRDVAIDKLLPKLEDGPQCELIDFEIEA
jgi:hypothetical protein